MFTRLTRQRSHRIDDPRSCAASAPIKKRSFARRLTAELLEDRRMLYGLTTGTGDASLSVSVDGYGAFGSAVGGQAGEAVYDPVGSIAAASTTYESGVAIRFGSTGARQFLTASSIGGSGGLSDVAVTGTSTTASSTFSDGGLTFNLLQTVALMTDSTGARTGSLLGQSYQITNPGTTSVSFELVRYMDGDLLFDGSRLDGGGRIVLSGSEFLFETDAGGGGTTATTFLGIDANGGTIPATNRFEVAQFSTLEEEVIAGNTLNGLISGDGNGDGFVDAGSEYDVTLAMVNEFTLAPARRPSTRRAPCSARERPARCRSTCRRFRWVRT